MIPVLPKPHKFSYMRANQYLALSLYMLLLAFFIALTVLFEIKDDKKQNVMSSIHDSFRGIETPFAAMRPQSDGTGNEADGGFLPRRQVKEMFGQSLGDLRITEKELPDGRFQMAATMPQSMFANYNEAFSRKLAEIISNTDVNTAFDIEIHIPFMAGQDRFIKDTLDSMRQNGLPITNVAVAMSPALDERDLQLRFVFSAPYDPSQSKAGGDAP